MKAKLLNKSQVGFLTNGTHLKGKIFHVTYNDMVETFGEPTHTSDDFSDGKVNFEWVFKFGDEVFTVYDWKLPEEYSRFILGNKGEYPWHVGGKSYALDFIDYIENQVREKVA